MRDRRRALQAGEAGAGDLRSLNGALRVFLPCPALVRALARVSLLLPAEHEKKDPWAGHGHQKACLHGSKEPPEPCLG